MLGKEQSAFTKIKNSDQLERLNRIVESLTTDANDLSYSDKSYILRVALHFISRYEDNNKLKGSLEFAYYLILKYSLIYKDYQPLYDFSVNFGLYPIAKAIKTYDLLENIKLEDIIIEEQLNDFSVNGFTAIKDQKEILQQINEIPDKEIAYVAPTSYGKSQLIFKHIQSSIEANTFRRFAIIVPTKSLIAQTHREVRKLSLGYKIITHDEMYNSEDKFIAILTQERALRMLQRPNLAFDILYIDEAHNLFEKDQRNIFLSRVIRLNEQKNEDQKLIYLSPLIADIDNLKILDSSQIKELRIDFSIKEPKYIIRDIHGRSSYYNRFLDKFYPSNKATIRPLISYIHANETGKNFIFSNTPKSIEQLAEQTFDFLFNNIQGTDRECLEISEILSKHVHENYNGTRYIKKGLIYLHGKTPTAIKDYLEYKFRESISLKYMIANHVVLQGINMPISSLFMVKGYGLKKNDIVNLVGRVNRLNEIFKPPTYLEKLEPKIYLIDNNDFNSNDTALRNKTKQIRSNSIIDVLQNPMLSNFDPNPLLEKLERARESNDIEKAESLERQIEKITSTQETEDFILRKDINLYPLETLKKDLIRSGTNPAYNLTGNCLQGLYNNIQFYKNLDRFKQLHIIDKITLIFIRNLSPNIEDYEIKRLENQTARNYYKVYMDTYRKLSLKENTSAHMRYFKSMRDRGDIDLYIGKQFGETYKSTAVYTQNARQVYINLIGKNDVKLINIAVIKVKIEDDFIRNKLKNLISLLRDWDLIDQEEYNIQVHGTNDPHQLHLIKQGLPFHLISRLEDESQLTNIVIDEIGNITTTSEFDRYLNNLDDFIQYEIRNSLGL